MTQPKPFPLPSRVRSQQSPVHAELAVTLLGPSAAMAQLWSQMRRLAPYLRTVLLTGEADCGQEAVARLLLDLSPASHRSFLQLTAAELETRLLRPAGLVAFPSDVLLFLPDAEKLSRPAGDALLRLMKMRRARPFTVVAATSEDLRTLVGVGRFSAELAEALDAIRLALPPLAQRAEDLPMLISHILATQSAHSGQLAPQVADDFHRAAMAHSWPGNLRELSETLAALCSGDEDDVLHGADLHRALVSGRPGHTSETASTRMVSLDTVMQEHIVCVLRACRGNKLRAAETLGISRSTLYRMLDSAAASQTGTLCMAG